MSWIRGTESSAGSGNFDGEQIETPRGDWEPDELDEAMPEDAPSTQEVIDRVWLQYIRSGADPRQLAKKLKVNPSTVYRAIQRAQLIEKPRSPHVDPQCAILFPINEFTRDSKCAHPVPMPQGRREYCPSCHKTGVEGHPALRHAPGDTESPRIMPPRDESLHGGTDSPKKAPRKPKSTLFRKTRRQATAV